MTDTDTDEFTCVHCGSDLAAGEGLREAAENLLDALKEYERDWMTSGTGYGHVRAMKGALRAALHPDTAETAYPGQHDDCIATVPHFHARPYQTNEYDKGNDDQRRKDEGELP